MQSGFLYIKIFLNSRYFECIVSLNKRQIFQALTQRQQRAPESSYVRFGKRAPDGLSYSGCVAYTLARATNRSDLLRMLVQNGCVKDKRLLHYAKKDGYIR